MINVKKFMKLNKVTLLVILVVLLVFLIPITYSRFENKLNTNAKIDAAFYVVDTKSEVKDIKLGDIVPSDNAYEYNFTVSNFNDKGRSEVNLEYTLVLKTTTNLPLSYELYMNSGENNILISEEIVKDEYGTYFNVMKTNKEIFNILNSVIVLDKIICLVVLVYLTFSSLLKPLFSLYSTSCLFNPSIIPPS